MKKSILKGVSFASEPASAAGGLAPVGSLLLMTLVRKCRSRALDHIRRANSGVAGMAGRAWCVDRDTQSARPRFANAFDRAKRLLFVLAVWCVLPAVGYAQYRDGFESLQGSASGVILTNQAGFERSGVADFHVYTYSGNSLGITQNPQGGSKFIAGIGPGPDMTSRTGATRPVSFGAGGAWEISYDLAVMLSGASTTGLEAIGLFQIHHRDQGSGGSAFFRNWLKWSGGGAGSQQLPGPLDVGYFGFNEYGQIFSFYGDNPGQDWARLSFNHWYRVSTIVDFDTNQVLQLGIRDLHSGRQTTFTPPSNVFLNGGALVPPGSTCTQRSASPSAPGECFLLPDAFNMSVYNEHVVGGKNVLAFDNVRIRAATNPRERGYVYDNGPTRGSGGSAIGHMIAADDFKLVADAVISRVSVDVSDGPLSENRRWDGNIEWWIFADNAGSPGNIIASGRGLDHRVHRMAESTTGNRNYTVDFDLDQEVQLQGGQTYWVGLHMQGDYSHVSIFWEYTSPFNSDSEGSAPTNATYRARSGGLISNGLPNFPADSATALSKELAFRFIPKQRCFTVFGRTVCLSGELRMTVISLAAILAAAAVAATFWGVWRKSRSRRRSKLSE